MAVRTPAWKMCKPVEKQRYWNFPWHVGQTLPEDDILVALLNGGHLAWGEVYQDTYYDPASKTAFHREVFCNGHSVFVLTRKVLDLGTSGGLIVGVARVPCDLWDRDSAPHSLRSGLVEIR